MSLQEEIKQKINMGTDKENFMHINLVNKAHQVNNQQSEQIFYPQRSMVI
jgi:hypothetical protein